VLHENNYQVENVLVPVACILPFELVNENSPKKVPSIDSKEGYNKRRIMAVEMRCKRRTTDAGVKLKDKPRTHVERMDEYRTP